MKHTILCLTLMLAATAASADELADAHALFAKKAYPEALQKYSRLANAGNAEAQQHLAQMYWYGEAGEVDEAKAEEWFRKAAAKGNKVAVASLEIMRQRVTRRADIDFWVNKYDGADLQSGEYRCRAPRFPALSKYNEEIERIGASMKAWQECYNRFVTNLNAASPLTKRIPPDLAKLMNKQESEKAATRLEQVHANIAESAKVSSQMVLADFAAWRDATETYVKQHNEIVRNAPTPERQRELDGRRGH